MGAIQFTQSGAVSHFDFKTSYNLYNDFFLSLECEKKLSKKHSFGNKIFVYTVGISFKKKPNKVSIHICYEHECIFSHNLIKLKSLPGLVCQLSPPMNIFLKEKQQNNVC